MKKIALFIVPTILVSLTLLVGAQAAKKDYVHLSFSGINMLLGTKCYKDMECIDANFKTAVFDITKQVIKYQKPLKIKLVTTGQEDFVHTTMIESTLSETLGAAGIKYSLTEDESEANMVILSSTDHRVYRENSKAVAECIEWVDLDKEKFNIWQGFNRAIVKTEKNPDGMRTGAIEKVFISFLKSGANKNDFKLTLLSAIGLPGLKSFAQKYYSIVDAPLSGQASVEKIQSFNNILNLMTKIYYSPRLLPNDSYEDFSAKLTSIYADSAPSFTLGEAN